MSSSRITLQNLITNLGQLTCTDNDLAQIKMLISEFAISNLKNTQYLHATQLQVANLSEQLEHTPLPTPTSTEPEATDIQRRLAEMKPLKRLTMDLYDRIHSIDRGSDKKLIWRISSFSLMMMIMQRLPN